MVPAGLLGDIVRDLKVQQALFNKRYKEFAKNQDTPQFLKHVQSYDGQIENLLLRLEELHRSYQKRSE